MTRAYELHGVSNLPGGSTNTHEIVKCRSSQVSGVWMAAGTQP
jgi:hypothetical protein